MNRLLFWYSKTSNEPSEKTDYISLQRTDHLSLIAFTIELIPFELPRSGHPQLRTTDADESQTYLNQYKISSENGQTVCA